MAALGTVTRNSHELLQSADEATPKSGAHSTAPSAKCSAIVSPWAAARPDCSPEMGVTPAGNGLASGAYSASVTNATSKVFVIAPSQCDPSTGNVTVTHSVTSTVTYKLVALA